MKTMRLLHLVILFSLFSLTIPSWAQETTTIQKEVESAFVYPQEDGDRPFGRELGDVVYGTVEDPLTGRLIHELVWRGIEVHRQVEFSRPGLVQNGDMLEEFTIVNKTDYPVLLRPGHPFSNNCKLRLKKHFAAPMTVQPHATLTFVLRYTIGSNNGTYRTLIRIADRDFVFPGAIVYAD